MLKFDIKKHSFTKSISDHANSNQLQYATNNLRKRSSIFKKSYSAVQEKSNLKNHNTSFNPNLRYQDDF